MPKGPVLLLFRHRIDIVGVPTCGNSMVPGNHTHNGGTSVM